MRAVVVILTAFALALGNSFCDSPGASDIERKQDVIQMKNLTTRLGDSTVTGTEILRKVFDLRASLQRSKRIEDFKFEATYKPHLELLIQENIKDRDRIVEPGLIKECRNYSNLHVVQFSIENAGHTSELLKFQLNSAEEYAERIMYYSFQISKDALLIEDDQDSLACKFAHFERTFDVSPKLNVTFVFERRRQQDPKQIRFVFEDIVFSNGKIQMEFDYSSISPLNIKNLKTELL